MTPFLEGLDRHFAFDVNLNGSKWWFICEIHCFQVALHCELWTYECVTKLKHSFNDGLPASWGIWRCASQGNAMNTRTVWLKIKSFSGRNGYMIYATKDSARINVLCRKFGYACRRLTNFHKACLPRCKSHLIRVRSCWKGVAHSSSLAVFPHGGGQCVHNCAQCALVKFRHMNSV